LAELELEKIAGRSHIIRGPVNIGIFESGDGSVVLIDSGNDDDAGRKLLKLCMTRRWSISLLLNTHSHADHCGGNSFIQARTNCRITATRSEAAFIETPVLEPSYLWGAYPLPVLRNKFLMSKASRVSEIFEAPCAIPQTELNALALPGHSIAMAGVMTPDKVCYIGDAVASREILAKYHVFYLYDIGAQLETLAQLASVEADRFVPCHAEPTREIGPLLAANKAKIVEISTYIEEACVVPSSPETLLASLIRHYAIQLNHAQYVLIGSTLRSYLTWLVDLKRLTSHFEGERLLFERI
jgi:glyoxylase-like metal-dependent hydrolase (beta-lactamase superfamily II)